MPSIRPILLAEDNANDAELTLTALASANLANPVIVARDGVQALDYLYCRGEYANRPCPVPAVLLLDLKMPRMDGREVLRHIRADPTLRGLPVVVLTSSREEIDLIESYRLGVNSYVVKPVDFDEFVSAVAKVGIFWALLNEPPPTATPSLERFPSPR